MGSSGSGEHGLVSGLFSKEEALCRLCRMHAHTVLLPVFMGSAAGSCYRRQESKLHACLPACLRHAALAEVEAGGAGKQGAAVNPLAQPAMPHPSKGALRWNGLGGLLRLACCWRGCVLCSEQLLGKTSITGYGNRHAAGTLALWLAMLAPWQPCANALALGVALRSVCAGAEGRPASLFTGAGAVGADLQAVAEATPLNEGAQRAASPGGCPPLELSLPSGKAEVASASGRSSGRQGSGQGGRSCSAESSRTGACPCFAQQRGAATAFEFAIKSPLLTPHC